LVHIEVGQCQPLSMVVIALNSTEKRGVQTIIESEVLRKSNIGNCF
jgi:hypothetical protein